jgi:hypothetical protein
MTAMKILIAGSLRHPEHNEQNTYPKIIINTDTETRFGAACQSLGKALTLRGHTIMTGVSSWEMLEEHNTVANFLVEGANGVDTNKNPPQTLIFHIPPDLPQPHKPIKHPYPIPTNPLSDKVLTSQKQLQEDFPHLRIDEKLIGSGDSKARVIPNIVQADAVMLISGRESTLNIGYAAYSMDKPVIAIRSFDGAAETIYENELSKDYKRFSKQGDIDGKDLLELGGDWDPDVGKNTTKAEAVVNVTEKLVKAYNKPEKLTKKVLYWSLGILIFLLVGWVYFYLTAAQATINVSPSTVQATVTPISSVAQTTLVPSSVTDQSTAVPNSNPTKPNPIMVIITILVISIWCWIVYFRKMNKYQDLYRNLKVSIIFLLSLLSFFVILYWITGKFTFEPISNDLCVQISFFLLLFISALLGTGLRTLVSFQNSQIVNLTPLGMISDLVTSLLVAFGLALVYLIGGISFTGTVVVLQSKSTESYQAFTTVAISMSFVGLAAGYLVPLNELKKRLENIFSQEGK